jgi:hypothetical protein
MEVMQFFPIAIRDSVQPLMALWSWCNIFTIIVIVVIQ